MSTVSEQNKEAIEGQKNFVKAILLCLAIVVFVRSFLFEPFKIPSSSMVPTLRIGDHIFVSKFNYGLSLPFTKLHLVEWGNPQRGDVIVFLSPRDESLHYIKRVIGIPGDRVEFKGRDLYINDELIRKQKESDESRIDAILGENKKESDELYTEFLGNSVHHVKYSKAAGSLLKKTSQVEVVPPGHFFVVGDSRDDSYDSRYWGCVPRQNIKGKAQIIWLSLPRDQAWLDLNNLRWDRFGTLIR